MIEWRELLQTFRARLTPEERVLADARAQGQPWAEIAAEQGGDARVLSKRWNEQLIESAMNSWTRRKMNNPTECFWPFVRHKDGWSAATELTAND